MVRAAYAHLDFGLSAGCLGSGSIAEKSSVELRYRWDRKFSNLRGCSEVFYVLLSLDNSGQNVTIGRWAVKKWWKVRNVIFEWPLTKFLNDISKTRLQIMIFFKKIQPMIYHQHLLMKTCIFFRFRGETVDQRCFNKSEAWSFWNFSGFNNPIHDFFLTQTRNRCTQKKTNSQTPYVAIEK